MPGLLADDELDALDIDGAPMDAAELEDGVGLVAPDSIDEAQLLEALMRDLHRGEQAKAVLVEAQMRRVIEASQSLGEGRFIEGLGQLQCRVPTAVFHHWGQRYGYEIWNNPADLMQYLGRLNPGFLVKSRGKTQVVVDGRREANDVPAAPAAGIPGEARPGGSGRANPRGVSGRRGRWAS